MLKIYNTPPLLILKKSGCCFGMSRSANSLWLKCPSLQLCSAFPFLLWFGCSLAFVLLPLSISFRALANLLRNCERERGTRYAKRKSITSNTDRKGSELRMRVKGGKNGVRSRGREFGEREDEIEERGVELRIVMTSPLTSDHRPSLLTITRILLRMREMK